jgi:Ner family transcriptional regulator
MAQAGPKAAPQDWHPEDIKAAIRKRGTTLEALSLAHGYSRSAVRMALLRPSPAVQAIVARFLGVAPQELWPSRYEADGSPRRSNRAKGSGRQAPRHRQKAEAA